MNFRHLKQALWSAPVLAAALLAAPVHATPILVTLASNNPTVLEGNSGSLIVTLTNNSGHTIKLDSGSLGSPTFSGDPSDYPTMTGMTQTCPAFGSTLGNGLSCTFTVTFSTPNDPGETDHDSGVTSTTASLTYDITGVGTGYTASTPVTITVQDPPVSAPEPSSLLLLGSGLLGMLGFGRKRLS
jgi:hypothetical protein